LYGTVFVRDEEVAMPARTQRLEARVSPEEAAIIRRAAALENVSASAFVVSSAVEQAEEVIASRQATAVPPDFFDRLLRSLEKPGVVVPALARAAKRRRKHR
jgi:uncharacterized protein (DUF1778 family)